MFPVRKPTKEELDTITPIILTSEVPWDPDNEHDDHDVSPDELNDAFLEEEQSSSGGHFMLNTMKKEQYDWTHIQRCLGYKPLDVCMKTMKNTTQYARNHLRLPMREHYKPRFPALNVKRLNETVCMDTFFASEKALGGFTCCQLFVGKVSRLVECFPLTNEGYLSESVEDFIRKWGAPNCLFSDNAKSEVGRAVKAILRKYNIKQATTEPGHSNQNLAERLIQEVKNSVNTIMDRMKVPGCLWYLCVEYVCYLLNRLSRETLNDRTPYEVATGQRPDISALLHHYFYQPVFYLDKSASFPESKERLGWWVGVAENCGDALTYKVLTTDFNVITRSVVRASDHPVHPNRRAAKDLEDRDDAIMTTLHEQMKREGSNADLPTFDPTEIVGKKFLKDINGNPHKAEVVEQVDPTRFKVVIGDGDREEILTYNEIMDFIDKKWNPDDNEQTFIFESVLDHRKGQNGRYEVLVKWQTGEETWEPLKEMIQADPVTLAKYAMEHDMLNTPQWKSLKRHAVETTKRYLRTMRVFAYATKRNSEKYKFGVRLPNNYRHAERLDAENGNTLWQDAVKTEMQKLHKYGVFKDLGVGVNPSPEYKKISVHMVYDVKYDGRRRARLVAGGHLTDPTNDTPYSGIASLKNVRACIFLGLLNGLDICAADIASAYLEAYTKEKIYIVAGPEFGELEGHTLLIVKALYGLRTSGGRWAELLADMLRKIGFRQTKVDPAIWMKDCGSHYEYIVLWVDDLLFISKNPMEIVKELEKKFTLQGVGRPEYYLGADMKFMEAPEGQKVFTMGSKTYVKRCLTNFERLMGFKPPKGVRIPKDPRDHPELDESDFLDEKGQKIYMSLMGMLQWAVTLGRVDIHETVMTMSRFRAQPRKGHLERLTKVFGYLNYYKSCSIKFRTDLPDYSNFKHETFDWQYIYGDVKEELPSDMPEPKGKEVIISVFHDANLYHCRVTGGAVTGILVMLNKTPVHWVSKRQSTVETATYGSEFVSGRASTDEIIEFRYALRMLGAPICGPSYLFGDNKSVVDSASIPDFNIKKRHLALCYHRMREAIAAGIIQYYHIDGKENPADVLTKSLPHPQLWKLMKPILHWIDTSDEGEDSMKKESET